MVLPFSEERKGVRFSRDPRPHKTVIALVINCRFFQSIVWWAMSFAHDLKKRA
jgi:hypothetical protein